MRPSALTARALARDLVEQLCEAVDRMDLLADAPVPTVDLCMVSYQYRENYGAHDWDGEGACPQFWKSKGGDDVIVAIPEGWTLGDVVEALRPRFEWDNHYSRQYVLGAERVSPADVASEFYTECAKWVPASALLLAA